MYKRKKKKVCGGWGGGDELMNETGFFPCASFYLSFHAKNGRAGCTLHLHLHSHLHSHLHLFTADDRSFTHCNLDYVVMQLGTSFCRDTCTKYVYST